MAIKPVPLIFLELSEKKTHLEKVKYLNENRNDMDFLLELSFRKDSYYSTRRSTKLSEDSGSRSV